MDVLLKLVEKWKASKKWYKWLVFPLLLIPFILLLITKSSLNSEKDKEEADKQLGKAEVYQEIIEEHEGKAKKIKENLSRIEKKKDKAVKEIKKETSEKLDEVKDAESWEELDKLAGVTEDVKQSS